MPPLRRYELTDEQWVLIRSLMPRPRPGGRWNDHSTTLDGMMWILKSGSPWREMPERYGTWMRPFRDFIAQELDQDFGGRPVRVLKVAPTVAPSARGHQQRPSLP